MYFTDLNFIAIHLPSVVTINYQSIVMTFSIAFLQLIIILSFGLCAVCCQFEQTKIFMPGDDGRCNNSTIYS